MAEAVTEKKHALLSPSGAHRWTRCPGSVVLEQAFPDDSSPYARWGSCAHEVAGLILETAVTVNGVSTDPDIVRACTIWNPENAEAYVGRVFQIDGHDVEFDMEMADCVNDYVAHVEAFWSPGDILISERALPIGHVTGEKDATGTSDCVILKPRDREIVVIDLKGGKGVAVDAEDNEQGLLYAAGAIEEHDLIHGPFERVRIVIIQPRLEYVSEWSLALDEFEERIEVIRDQAARCQALLGLKAAGVDVGPDLTPGEKQCKFCKAKSTCPALRGEVSDMLAKTAPPARADEFPDLSLPKQAAAAAPTEHTDGDALAEAWRALPLIETWAEAVRAEVHRRLHDGIETGNLTLYEGKRGARFWKDAEAAEARMKKSRVKVDDMYDRKLISPTQAEKVFKDSKVLWKDLAALIGQKDGNPVVGVQGDPKRTPWQPVKVEEFPDLDAEEDDLFA